MKSNVIILTSGLTGSSVLTGLISQAGYWTGNSTMKKKDYNTFENSELIDLNLRIFEAADFQENYLTHFSPEAIGTIGSLAQRIDTSPFRAFLNECNQHQPWVWKDPRLWMTIHFWKDIVDLNKCKFIVLTRDFRQLWVSTILRRQIVSYPAHRSYEMHVRDSAIDFLNKNQLSHITVRYEDIVVRPSPTLAAINSHLGTELTLDSLRRVYRKPLYKLPSSSPLDFLKAFLIYVKNHSERIDVRQTH
jgi:hypothetical protein